MLDRKFDKLGGILGGIGVAMGAVAVAAGAAAIKLGKEVVQQFGELEQNLGGSEAVFGTHTLRLFRKPVRKLIKTSVSHKVGVSCYCQQNGCVVSGLWHPTAEKP